MLFRSAGITIPEYRDLLLELRSILDEYRLLGSFFLPPGKETARSMRLLVEARENLDIIGTKWNEWKQNKESRETLELEWTGFQNWLHFEDLDGVLQKLSDSLSVE